MCACVLKVHRIRQIRLNKKKRKKEKTSVITVPSGNGAEEYKADTDVWKHGNDTEDENGTCEKADCAKTAHKHT